MSDKHGKDTDMMPGFDIVSFIQNNISTLAPTAQFVAGAVASAMFLRKKTSVETGTKEFEKIKAAQLGEAADMLLDSGRLTYSEYWKMKNYSDIAKKADELKEQQLQVLPEQSLDWHVRFYEACGNISDEDMQELWARVLSGEIEQPGSYSLRTLECLRNLSKEEAELFKKICDCSVVIGKSTLLPRFGGIMEKNGITYDDVLRLEDCGLLKSDVGMSVGMSVSENFGILTSDDRQVLAVKKREGNIKNKLEMPQYLFTAIGRELYSVVGGKTNISELCKVLQNEYQDYEFTVGQVIAKQGNQVRYSMTLTISEIEVAE